MSRGHARERAVRDWYTERGYLAFRAPASLGVADVVALKAGHRPILTEVKSTAAGPYSHFLPADRQRLLDAAEVAGAIPMLAFWPPRGPLVWFPSSSWPKAKVAA